MLGERGRPDRRGWSLANHIPGFFPAGARRETHPAATGTVALPKHQDMQEISRNIMKINDLHKPVQKYQAMERNREPREIHERVIVFAWFEYFAVDSSFHG